MKAVPLPRDGLLCYAQKNPEVKQVLLTILVRNFDDLKKGINQDLMGCLCHMSLNVPKLQATVG